MSGVGERLRTLRGGATQIQFAERLGVDKNTVGRYERGERLPDIEYLTRIQSEFNVSMDWLLLGMSPTQTQSQSQTTPPPAEPPAPLPRPEPATVGSQKAGHLTTSSLNDELIEACVVGIENLIQEKRLRISPIKKAQLIIALYHAIEEKELNEKLTGTPPDSSATRTIIERLVKLAS